MTKGCCAQVVREGNLLYGHSEINFLYKEQHELRLDFVASDCFVWWLTQRRDGTAETMHTNLLDLRRDHLRVLFRFIRHDVKMLAEFRQQHPTSCSQNLTFKNISGKQCRIQSNAAYMNLIKTTQ